MGKTIEAKPEHQVAYGDLCKLLEKHGDKVSAVEMLAIACNAVGKLIAMQDKRRYTSADMAQVVQHNIEKGNAEAMDMLLVQGKLGIPISYRPKR